MAQRMPAHKHILPPPVAPSALLQSIKKADKYMHHTFVRLQNLETGPTLYGERLLGLRTYFVLTLTA
jgi:hypothetical protein